MAPNRSWQTTPLDESSAAPTTAGTLRHEVESLVHDRVSSAAEHVRLLSRIVRDWVLRHEDWDWSAAGRELEVGLAPWEGDQCWRGTAALWLDSMRKTWHWGATFARAAGPRSVLGRELELWIKHVDRESATFPHGLPHWNGEPLAPGPRLSDRARVARAAARALARDEIILAPASSDALALAVLAAREAGAAPRVVLGPGGPTRDGHRLALRLSRAGVPVTMCCDAALIEEVASVDRIWLSTEAIGIDAFLAPVGTCKLIEEALRHDVPVELLATSDKLMPGGALRFPDWPQRERSTLWPDVPTAVELRTQLFEAVPMELAGNLITEMGPETATELSLRALRLEPAAPCAARARTEPDDD